MKKLNLLVIVLLTSLIFGTNINGQDVIDASTLNHKIMAGYQGWFNTPNDGNQYGWIHWPKNGGKPSADNISIDMWPDLREYDSDELDDTYFVYKNLNNAGLFSSYNKKTVDRHIKWMKDYGIDGSFVQRFISSALSRRDQRDTVLQNVKYASENHGRVFANMYDLSGCKASVVEDIKNDWMHLVDDLKITESPNYLHHDGRPVLSLWGLNVGGSKEVLTPALALELATWLSEDAPEKYRVTLKAGVGNGWRTDNSDWQKAYDKFKFISPWAVGRYRDEKGADNYRSQYFNADLKETADRGMDYMPVVFPGFSWTNLYPDDGGALNKIPRDGGKFLWRQFYNAVDAGCNMVYVAMYDEVDEGTAIFKIAENVDQIPTTGKFVTLDIDGYKLPSDWYLRLTGEASKMLRKEIPTTTTIPIVAYPNDAESVSQDMPSTMAPSATSAVSVTMKNTGTTSWTKSGGYTLTFDETAGNNSWGIDAVELSAIETIAPGESKTFTFTISAPNNNGVFPFQWRMKQESVDWIGTSSTNVLINVATDFVFLDDCDAITDWTSAGSLQLNTADQKQGTGCLEFTGGPLKVNEYEKIFSAPFNSGISENDAVLQFWYFVSDSEKEGSGISIGMGSKGKADEDAYTWNQKKTVTGWNLINLPVSEAQKQGTPDLNAINWLRISSMKTGEITTRLDEIQILDKNAGATRYDLTVNNGNGSGAFSENSIITITADPAAAGQVFIGWEVISGNPVFEDQGAVESSVRMPAEDVEVTAKYKLLGAFLDDCDLLTGWGSSAPINLNTSDQKEGFACIEFVGSSTDEYKKSFIPAYNSGASAETGKLRFWYYTSDASLMGATNQVEIGSGGGPDQDEYSWTLSGLSTGWNQVTLDLTAAGVIGTPDLSAINHFRIYNFKSGVVTTRIDAIEIIDENAGERHSLTVQEGEGDGNYYTGVNVTISANEGPEGQYFDQWIIEAGNPEIDNKISPNTTLLMPNENVIISASYKAIGKQTLTVNNGSGSGEYDAGQRLMIRASILEGKRFLKWEVESGTPTLANENSSFTFLTMGANAAIVSATYESTVSVEDTESNPASFTIYPNPASEFINVSIHLTTNSKIEINVYDLKGKSVIANYFPNKQSGKQTLSLPVSDLYPGMYIVRISIDNQVTSQLVKIK